MHLVVMTRKELPYGRRRLPADQRLHLAVRRFLKILRLVPWDAVAADGYADTAYQLGGTC